MERGRRMEMRTLLIADDERIIREGLSRLLDWHTLQIGEILLASDGAEALEILRTRQVDIALLDIEMPEMNALELMEQSRKEGLRTEFIIVTGYDRFSYAQTAIQYGVSDYLLKPCDPKQLQLTVSKIVKKLDKNDQEEQAEHAQLFRDMVDGKLTRKEDVVCFKKVFHLNEVYYRLILTTFQPFCGDGQEKPKSAPKENRLLPGYPILLEENRAIFLAATPTRAQAEEITGVLRRELSASARNPQLTIISRAAPIKDLPALAAYFNRLIPILSYFKGKELVFAEDCQITDDMDAEFSESYLYSLTHAIRNEQPDIARKVIGHLYEFCKSQLIGFELARDLCIQTIVLMIRFGFRTPEDHTMTIRKISDTKTVAELFDLLGLIARIGAPPTAQQSLNTSNAISQVLRYIDRHLSDSDLSLHQIATEDLFMNPDYLGKLFKKECGIKFNSYLLSVRMLKAEELLRDTEDRMYEVATKVGFGGNTTYFSQMFKKHTGMLPKEYRTAGICC